VASHDPGWIGCYGAWAAPPGTPGLRSLKLRLAPSRKCGAWGADPASPDDTSRVARSTQLGAIVHEYSLIADEKVSISPIDRL